MSILVGSSACGGSSVTETTTGSTGALTNKYIMAFHSCDTASLDCTNPKNHTTQLAQSNDGANWAIVTGWPGYQGSVPGVIRRGNTLYFYNASAPLRRYDIPSSTLSAAMDFSITKADGTKQSWVDPTPILDSNNNIVIFYPVIPANIPPGQDPATASCPSFPCTLTIRACVEVAGSDGSKCQEPDNQDRLAITRQSSSDGTVSDPDIFRDAAQNVLYVSRGTNVQVFTSSTLLGTYSQATTAYPGGLLVIPPGAGGVPSGYFDSPSSSYWSYVNLGTRSSSNPSKIYRAVHSALNTPLKNSDFTAVVTGSSIGLGSTFMVESPTVRLNQ